MRLKSKGISFGMPRPFRRSSTTSYPLGSTEAFTYDAADNLLTRQSRAGPTSVFTLSRKAMRALVFDQ
jgi:YD repeat-containing protein